MWGAAIFDILAGILSEPVALDVSIVYRLYKHPAHVCQVNVTH